MHVQKGRGIKSQLTILTSFFPKKKPIPSGYLLILKPRRGPGQGDGPRRPENIGRRIAIRRSKIDRDVNFAKKNPNFVKMNTESINLTENPSDFVEPYFTKKHF